MGSILYRCTVLPHSGGFSACWMQKILSRVIQCVLRQEPFFEWLSANNNCMLTRWTECSQASANTRTHAHTHEYVRTWLVSAELCMLTILTHAYMHVLLCMCKVTVTGFFTIVYIIHAWKCMIVQSSMLRTCVYVHRFLHAQLPDRACISHHW